MMKHQKIFQQIIYLTLVVLLLAGCGGDAPKSVSETPVATATQEQTSPTPTLEPTTPTPEPPTATPTSAPPKPTPEPPTATPTPEPPTQTPEPPIATPTQELATPTSEPPAATPTQEPISPTPELSSATEEVSETGPMVEGDLERGREIFETGGDVLSPINRCASCHTLDGTLKGNARSGPSLKGIAEYAGNRVSDLTAIEYIRQSIVDPNAYVVNGFDANRMPRAYSIFMTEEDIDDMIAFLLTQ